MGAKYAAVSVHFNATTAATRAWASPWAVVVAPNVEVGLLAGLAYATALPVCYLSVTHPDRCVWGLS